MFGTVLYTDTDYVHCSTVGAQECMAVNSTHGVHVLGPHEATPTAATGVAAIAAAAGVAMAVAAVRIVAAAAAAAAAKGAEVAEVATSGGG